MNELGLTRESVKDQVGEIVGEIVRKEISRLLNEGGLRRIVTAEVDRSICTGGWDKDKIRDLIAKAASQRFEHAIRGFFPQQPVGSEESPES